MWTGKLFVSAVVVVGWVNYLDKSFVCNTVFAALVMLAGLLLYPLIIQKGARDGIRKDRARHEGARGRSQSTARTSGDD